MRTTGILFLAALVCAALIAATASREPFAARLIRLEAARAAPDIAPVLADESLAMNAVFAHYADRPVLRLNAQLSLLKHPDLAREVLPLYGSEPEFQDVLARFGPTVLLPVGYFMHHDVTSLEVLHATGEAVRSATRAAGRLLGVTGEDDAARPATGTGSASGGLSPEARGWYAIGFIRDEGHDFLGQFVLDDDDRVQWVQTERITEGATSLFSGGIRALETKLRQDDVPTTTDYLWAGVDLALAAGAVKVLRAGRAAGAGATSATRASLASRTLLRAGRTALRVGRFGVPVAVAYAVVRHPSLISGLAAQAAAVLGLPVPVVQTVVWFTVLLPLLLVLRLVLRWLVRPALAVLRATTRGLLRLEKHRRAARHVPASDPPVRVAPRIGDLSPSVEPHIGDHEPIHAVRSPDSARRPA